MAETAAKLSPEKMAPNAASISVSHVSSSAKRAGIISRQSRRYIPLCSDIFLVILDGVFIFWIRFGLYGSGVHDVSKLHYLGLLALYTTLVTLYCQNQGLYDVSRIMGPLDESFSILKAIGLSSLLLVAFIYISGDKSISRLVVGFSAVLNAVTLAAWRLCKSEFVKNQVASGKHGRHVLILGTGEVAQALAEHLEKNSYLGYVVKGFLDYEDRTFPLAIGTVSDFSTLARIHFVDEIFITAPIRHEIIEEVLLEAREFKIDVKVVPEFFDGLGWFVPIRYVGDFPVMELLREPIPALGLLVKRVVDMISSAIALLTLAPILGVIALMIRLDSKGPVIYRAWRIGRKGRRFICYKFRTMVANADQLKDGLRHMNEREGPLFKITNDPRITGIGRFLRRYSLDELPQFWNVLKGEMSLVGPRPHPLDDYQKYQVEDLRRLDVKPGVTGLWQVYARTDPSFQRNLALDLEYIENWSLWLDAKVILKTIPVALNGSGK